MVKLAGPLFSLNAHGSIDSALTYSGRKSGSQVRFQKRQKNYENIARKAARDAFRYAVDLWGSMPPIEKAYWKEISKNGYAII